VSDLATLDPGILAKAIVDGDLTYDMVEPALFCQDKAAIEGFEDFVEKAGINLKAEVNAELMNVALVNGMCRRALLIPKGMFITGRIHKAPYVDMIINGDVSVQVPDGIERYQGFNLLEGLAGRKRVLYTHETTLWVTVDRTDAETVEEAENDITVSKYCEYDDFVSEIKK
jgi:hypothetical protein